MSGLITEKKFLVQNNEVDKYNNIYPEIILSYLQDTAMEQSENIGVGLEFLIKENLNWILIRYHVQILKYPQYNEKIRVLTHAVGFNKMFAYRDFKVQNEEGEVLVTAGTQWLLVDATSHTMLKIDDQFYKAYGVSREDKVPNKYEKLLSPKKNMITKKLRAGKADIDFNGHVNNTRYIAWILDNVPEEILCDYELKEFDIIYKKEVLNGQQISVYTQIQEAGAGVKGLHEIRNDQDEVSCCINTNWDKRKPDYI